MRNEPHLARRAANFQPLSPLAFLDRALAVHPDRPSVIWRDRRWSYQGFADIVSRMASSLASRGVKAGDVVSIVAANRPEMLAAHYAVPMLGAVLNTINTRLDLPVVTYILKHADSQILITDPACAELGRAAAAEAGVPVIELETEEGDFLTGEASPLGDMFERIADEWQPLCVNYTSGTTGDPKGVVYHHRGAYLNAIGNVLALRLDDRSVYLWTLPMFHCNGWCHTWAVTAAGGLHVCLDRVDPEEIFKSIGERDVTHMACAPVVLYMLLNHPERENYKPSRRIQVASGGAAPSVALISGLDALGFDFLHLYGLTESYGPVSLCEVPADEAARLDGEEKAAKLARQGSRHATANRIRVIGEDGGELPWDGASMGEITLKGNTLMAGYYRDAEATEKAFSENVFHTGDLAVRHPNGEIEIRDRAKDVIISGGENISSLEIENALHRHPSVLLAAVVAESDPKWGEVPRAFVELKDGASLDAEELRLFCREHLAHYKVPKSFTFGTLPRTATGKIQKFVLRDHLAPEHADR